MYQTEHVFIFHIAGTFFTMEDFTYLSVIQETHILYFSVIQDYTLGEILCFIIFKLTFLSRHNRADGITVTR